MLFIAAIAMVVGVVLGFLRGGSITQLMSLSIRHTWLVVVAFTVQALMFATPLQDSLGDAVAPLLMLSNLAVIAMVALNWRVPGLPIFAIGLFANTLVMLLNGGYMPVSAEALRAAGMEDRAEQLLALDHHDKSQLMTPETRLPFLGDVIALRPVERVISVGDVFVGAGVAWLIAAGMTRPVTVPAPLPTPRTRNDERLA